MTNPVPLSPVGASPLQKKERIVWVDQLRGIAFFFVILGHLGVEKTFKSWIYSFHMPIFFFITGFNYNMEKLAQTKPLDYLKKLCLRLLVPYMWMQLLSICLRFIQKTLIQHTEVPVALYLRGILRGHSRLVDAPSNPLYFVLVLFCAELLLYCIIKLTRGKKPLVFALTFACLPLSLFTETVRMRWHLNVVPACACMILCGYLLGQLYRAHEDKIKSLRLWQQMIAVVLLLAFGAAVWYFNGRTSIHGNHWGHDFTLAMLTAIATSTALALLCMKLPRIAWLNLAGQSTLLFMGFHKPVILILEALFPAQKKTALFLVCAAVGVYLLMLPVSLWFRRFAPFVGGKDSDFSDWKVKLGQAVCVVGATCVPYLYFINHLKGGLLRSTTLYLVLAVAGYLVVCAVLYVVLRRFVRFPFLPEKKEPTA